MELHQALGPTPTRLGRVKTGVQTVLVDASFVERTVGVGSTLRSVALAVRVTSVAFRTGANRMVSPGGALRLGGAGVVNNARVYAVLVNTGLALRTVWVLCALRSGLD